MSVPVIFIHSGYAQYMEFTLRQAGYSSPDSKIILLGDEQNDRFDFVTHVNMKDYYQGAEEFKLMYRHMSTNPADYELFCIQRWFILYEYICDQDIDELFVCDSDVLLYHDMNKVYQENFSDVDFSLYLRDNNATASAGLAFISRRILGDMCEFIRKAYTDPDLSCELERIWSDVSEQKKLGGVSDMTLVAMFLRTLPEGSFRAINDVNHASTFDWNINMSLGSVREEYEFSGRKKIVWKKSVPYCHNLIRGELVRFHALHFQGPAKYYSARCYTGPDFQACAVLKMRFFLLDCLARLYSKFKIRKRFAPLFDFYFKLKGQA